MKAAYLTGTLDLCYSKKRQGSRLRLRGSTKTSTLIPDTDYTGVGSHSFYCDMIFRRYPVGYLFFVVETAKKIYRIGGFILRFMDEVVRDSMEIWDACANERFLNEMADGTLSREKFFDYIIQDSLYLRDYLKVFAYALVKAKNLDDMKEYYGCLGFINEGENATRIVYLKDMGMTDADVDKMQKRKQCEDYCNFLIAKSAAGTEEDILMAMLPCMVGYRYVFESLKRRAPQVMNGYYAPLVADYTTEEYGEVCRYWLDFTNQKCENLNEKRKKELNEIFRQASLHELYFWQMAGEDK